MGRIRRWLGLEADSEKRVEYPLPGTPAAEYGRNPTPFSEWTRPDTMFDGSGVRYYNKDGTWDYH
jgi:hypothetical protein